MRKSVLAFVGFAVTIALVGRFLWLAAVGEPPVIPNEPPVIPEKQAPSVDEMLDPRLEKFTGFLPRCSQTRSSHIWVCGSVIEMPGAHQSARCTSQEAPYFVGSLSLPGQEPFYSRVASFVYQLPLEPLTPCEAGQDAETNRCASLSISERQDLKFGVFDAEPPDPLPVDFPPPPYSMNHHQLEPIHFAELDGAAVALFYVRLIGPREGVSPDRCSLSTRLDNLNVGLRLSMACSEMASWRSHLRSAIAGVKDGVVSFDPVAECGVPPENAVIRGNQFSQEFTENMPLWMDLHR